jgi:hypothetical protein
MIMLLRQGEASAPTPDKHLAVILVASFLTIMLGLGTYQHRSLGKYVLRYRSIHHDVWIPWKWFESGLEAAGKGKRPRHPYAILFEQQDESTLEGMRRRALFFMVFSMAFWMGGGIVLLNWLIR